MAKLSIDWLTDDSAGSVQQPAGGDADKNSKLVPEPAKTQEADQFTIENGIGMLTCPAGNDEAIQSLLGCLGADADFKGINMSLYTPLGGKTKVLLVAPGREEALVKAAAKLQTMMSKMGDSHVIVISAFLNQVDLSNNLSYGLNWFNGGAVSASGTIQQGQITRNTSPQDPSLNATNKTNAAYGNAQINGLQVGAELSQIISQGKVITGSEMTVVNGGLANLTNDDTIPVPLQTPTQLGGSTITFNTQVITSDVKITPTIVSYDELHPGNSIVCLDINMKLSVPTGTVVFENGATAMQYTTQTLTSMQYVQANNIRYIGGLFASDNYIKGVSGIPGLMDIPFIGKYLFSTNNVVLTHSAAILTVAVRILPKNKVGAQSTKGGKNEQN